LLRLRLHQLHHLPDDLPARNLPGQRQWLNRILGKQEKEELGIRNTRSERGGKGKNTQCWFLGFEALDGFLVQGSGFRV
jgi:hypothetical protein